MRPQVNRYFFVATCLLILAGCQTAPVALTGQKEMDKKIDATLAQAVQDSHVSEMPEVPAEISRALLPGFQFKPSSQRQPPKEKRFDISATEADVREVLVNLVEGTNYSLVMHPQVVGNVSLQLKNTTVFDALDTLRDIYGYDYEQKKNRLMIYGAQLQTRVYPVNYLNFKRTGSSDMQVSSSGLDGSSGSNGIKLKTASETDFWTQLQATLAALVGEEEGRKVQSNPQTGLVIVRAMPEEQRLVERYLGMTHANINRQVILEAKIIQVDLSDDFQAGINWTSLFGSGNFSSRVSQTGGGSLPASGGASGIAGNTANLANGNVSNSVASAFGGVFSVSLRVADFATFAELLQTQGDVKVLSSPRVSTVNNQKAVIKVGGDEYFVTGVSSSSTDSATGTTSTPDIELESFFSGIALDVTPQIDEYDNIILHIHPTISEVSQRSKTFTIGDQSFSLPLAFSTVQESDNIVRAQSGQMVVIGGLMKDGTSNQNAIVPFLGKIPLLGALFKHKRVTRQKQELVILLKPTVVGFGSPVWQQQLEANLNRTRSLTGFASQ